jgi:excinuclease ABC subunit B
VDLDISQTVKELEEEMLAAANNLEFEKAALLRDQIRELNRTLDGVATAKPSPAGSSQPVSYGNRHRKGKGKRRSADIPF